MRQGFEAVLCSGLCWIALVALHVEGIVTFHVQAGNSVVEAGVRQARCPLALMQLNASPGLISVSKDHPSTSTASAVMTSTTKATTTTTTKVSTTFKGAVQNIVDHLDNFTSKDIVDPLDNVTSKAANATHNISVAAGGVLASAWNATEGAASDVAAWASEAASGVKHALGIAADTVSNVFEEVVSSVEDSMNGTANNSNSSNSTSSNASEGIVGRFVDEVADDVDGASQAVAHVVGSGFSHAGGSKHSPRHHDKHRSGTKSNHDCVTQKTENGQALSSYVSPAGSPCFFGGDDRDEDSHCIDQGGEYGPNGWCWTSEDLESWGKCANGCPLSGADKVLEKELEHIEKQLEDIESENRTH